MYRLALMLSVIVVLAGCATESGEGKCPFDLWGRNEQPEIVTVTVWLAPVVADLDFQGTPWGREQAIVEGGFQHVLSVRGPDTDPWPALTRSALAVETVHFASGSDRLDESAQARLSRLVLPLPADKLHVKVEGHTDAIGNLRYNDALSQRRAESVRRFLVAHGVRYAHIETTGHGETLPIATNRTSQGRAANRRATVTATGD